MFKSHCFKQWQGVFATVRQIETIKTTKTMWNGDVMRGEFFERGYLFIYVPLYFLCLEQRLMAHLSSPLLKLLEVTKALCM